MHCHLRQSDVMPLPEHVSVAGAAEFPHTAQTNFCDSRSPLRSPLRHLSLPLRSRSAPAPANFFHTRSPLRSRSPDFWPAPLQFRSAPKQQTEKWRDFYRASSYASAVLAVVIPYVSLSVCLSVCLSATRVLYGKTKQCTTDILIPHERAITLVF